MLRRLSTVLAVLPLLAACTGSATTSHRSTEPPSVTTQSGTTQPAAQGPTTNRTPPESTALPVRAWHARLVGDISDLESATLTTLDGHLYATTLDSHHLVRLDPRTGSVLAQSKAVLSDDGVVAPVSSGDLIWAVAQDSRTVLGFDPVTLRVTVHHSLDVTGKARLGPALAPDRASGGVVLGYAETITFINTRGIQHTLAVGQPVSALALSPDGSRLYVGLATSGAGGTLAVLDPNNGVEMAPQFHDEAIVGLAATAGGVWYGAAGGMSAYIGFMHTDGTVVRNSAAIGASGGGEDDPPTISGGLAWLGGYSAVGCADPDSGALRAHAAVGTQGYVSALTLVHHNLFAIFFDVNSGKRMLITLRPPASCSTAQ